MVKRFADDMPHGRRDGVPLTPADRRMLEQQKKRGNKVPLPNADIKSVRELTRLIDRACVLHLDDLSEMCRELGLDLRNNGLGKRPKAGFNIARHDLRSAVDAVKQSGYATSLGDAYWYFEGTKEEPTRATFIIYGEVQDFDMVLSAAADASDYLGGSVDLIFADPPWQRGFSRWTDSGKPFDQFGRSSELILPGYNEMRDDADFMERTLEWLKPATEKLKFGGYVAVVTDPEHSADVQYAGKLSGLSFSNSIVVPKASGVQGASRHAPRHYATSHYRITVMTSGPYRLPSRTYNTHPFTHRDRSGRPFPRDVFDAVNPNHHRGIRNRNELPLKLLREVVLTYTNKGDSVAEFFAGSFGLGHVCALYDRKYIGSDNNPNALRLGIARTTAMVEHRKSMLDVAVNNRLDQSAFANLLDVNPYAGAGL